MFTQPSSEDLAHVLDHTREPVNALRGRHCSSPAEPASSVSGCWKVFSGPTSRWNLGAKAVVLTREPRKRSPQRPRTWPEMRRFGLSCGRRPRFRVSSRQLLPCDPCGHRGERETERGEPAADAGDDRRRHAADVRLRPAMRGAKFLLISSGPSMAGSRRSWPMFRRIIAGAPDPTSPASAYGEGKRIAEHLGVLYAQGQRHGGEDRPRISPLWAPICRWTPILPSAISSGDALRGGPIVVAVTATPIAPICMPPIWRYGFGESCSKVGAMPAI